MYIFLILKDSGIFSGQTLQNSIEKFELYFYFQLSLLFDSLQNLKVMWRYTVSNEFKKADKIQFKLISSISLLPKSV